MAPVAFCAAPGRLLAPLDPPELTAIATTTSTAAAPRTASRVRRRRRRSDAAAVSSSVWMRAARAASRRSCLVGFGSVLMLSLVLGRGTRAFHPMVAHRASGRGQGSGWATAPVGGSGGGGHPGQRREGGDPARVNGSNGRRTKILRIKKAQAGSDARPKRPPPRERR